MPETKFLLKRIRPCVVALCFTLTVAPPGFCRPARGADAPHSQPATSNATAAPANSNDTRIVTDEKNHVVRVLIGGKDVVVIDARGLHVTGDVTYTGTEADVGSEKAVPPK